MKITQRLGLNRINVKKENIETVNQERFKTQEKRNHHPDQSEKSKSYFEQDLFPLLKTEEFIFREYLRNKEAKILVAGCGTGRIPFHLLRMGFTKIVAFDIIPEVIQIAKKIEPSLDFRVLDATNLNEFNAESFDLVIFPYNGIDYIHPIEKRKKALREIHRILNVGGQFIFSSHNSRLISYKKIPVLLRTLLSGLLFTGYYVNYGEHGFIITKYSSIGRIKKELAGCGFKDIHVKGDFSSTVRNYVSCKYCHYIAKKEP